MLQERRLISRKGKERVVGKKYPSLIKQQKWHLSAQQKHHVVVTAVQIFNALANIAF